MKNVKDQVHVKTSREFHGRMILKSSTLERGFGRLLIGKIIHKTLISPLAYISAIRISAFGTGADSVS